MEKMSLMNKERNRRVFNKKSYAMVKKKLQWSELISSEILMLPIWDDASG